MAGMPLETISCSCEVCQSACKRKPGWFHAGEIEQTANLLDISVQELFDNHLTVDYQVDVQGGNHKFAISPATVHGPKGKEATAIPVGRCTFYTDDGKCAIHAAKPHECRNWDHRRSLSDRFHQEALQSWQTPEAKQQIAALLKRPPHVDMSIGTTLRQFDEANPKDVALFLLSADTEEKAKAIFDLLTLRKGLIVLCELWDLLTKMERKQDGRTESGLRVDGLPSVPAAQLPDQPANQTATAEAEGERAQASQHE